MSDPMSEAMSILEKRLPLRAKGESVLLQLAGPPTSADGELCVTLQLAAFDDTGEIGELFEIEQVLIPLLPGVSTAAAATYVEAWIDTCQAVLEERGASGAFHDEAVPFYGVNSNENHPLRTPDADRTTHGDAILRIRAEQMKAAAENKALYDRVMAAYAPTRRVFVRLIPGPASSEGLTGSRLGGIPYLPEGVDYPRDPSSGQPLLLAAQIDFSEVPELDGFPTHGIFQIFVRNDVLGAGLVEPSCARVLFHAEVDVSRARPRSWFSFLPEAFCDDAPGARECSLTFSRDDEMMSAKDHRFEALVAETGVEPSYFEDNDIISSGSGHKLGGYPYCWTGDDVRGNGVYRDRGYELFLQLDTDDEVPVVWGRHQTLKLHMHPAALARGDFSDVLFDMS